MLAKRTNIPSRDVSTAASSYQLSQCSRSSHKNYRVGKRPSSMRLAEKVTESWVLMVIAQFLEESEFLYWQRLSHRFYNRIVSKMQPKIQ